MCVFPPPPLSQFLCSLSSSMKKKLVDHVDFFYTISLSISLSSLLFSIKKKRVDHVCFLSTISLWISFFIVVFYKEESLQIMCIFSPPSHTQSLSLHCCFLWRSLYINHVLSPTSLSQNWISFHFLFSMKKKLNISCVFFSHCCFLISCHHGMFFLDHLSQLSFNLFLFVFYEEEPWGSNVSLLTNHSLVSLTHI